MFFIVTTGRSGSTSIAKYISSSDNHICLHEPEPTLINESTKYLYKQFSHQVMVETLKVTRPSHIKNKEYGESNQKLSFIIPAINDAFPESKFIWLVRDGRDVVNSIYSLGWYDPNLLQQSPWQINLPQAPEVGELNNTQWEAMSPFQKCCWYWSFTNKLIQQELSIIDPARWILIHLECIDFDKINLFVGTHDIKKNLPWSNKRKKIKKNKTWIDWDERKKYSFQELCGRQMDLLYPGWISENGEWIDIFKLSSTIKVKNYFQNILVNVEGKQSLIYKIVSIPIKFIFKNKADKILIKLTVLYKKISGEL
ncbi:MAG: hypothetical protein SCH71_15550 [Desulfobulbaceae bacterium]|nr:hypothetical protein [Desulfobulbaceae bacterium]